MSTWFNISSMDELTSKVKAAIPKVDKEMLAKLTLTTPEMKAERNEIYEDEQRKERVKNSLTGMLPWETRDAGREILVEDCKEAILALSAQEGTFEGPYELPAKDTVHDEIDQGCNGGNGDSNSEDSEDGEDYQDQAQVKLTGPSLESLAKLAKLEPLPTFLADFDLDAHVGLIKRLLQLDPNLVKMQSSVSGGGERERTFWRNYFFQCAYTRYEAGLSVDEIWCDKPITNSETGGSEGVTSDKTTIAFEEIAATEEELASQEGGTGLLSNVVALSLNKGKTIPPLSSTTTPSTADSLDSPPVSVGAEYEFVTEAEDDDGASSEMDELEAEIARELSD